MGAPQGCVGTFPVPGVKRTTPLLKEQQVIVLEYPSKSLKRRCGPHISLEAAPIRAPGVSLSIYVPMQSRGWFPFLLKCPFREELELELELIQSNMAQKPVLRGEVGCACVAREVSVERVRTFKGRTQRFG